MVAIQGRVRMRVRVRVRARSRVRARVGAEPGAGPWCLVGPGGASGVRARAGRAVKCSLVPAAHQRSLGAVKCSYVLPH